MTLWIWILGAYVAIRVSAKRIFGKRGLQKDPKTPKIKEKT